MPRIDDSHSPYKRTTVIGPGPKRAKPKRKVGKWECKRGKKPYEQICTWVGEGKRKPQTSRMNKAKKKVYNKRYRAWAKRNRAKLQNRGRIKSYRCKRTKFARCK